MMRNLLVAGLAALAGTTIGLASAKAAITVNCGTFPGISDAIALGHKDVFVNGTCTEDVFVSVDDVTIAGGANGEIAGTLSVVGAKRFTIRNMTVTVPGIAFEGVLVMNGASATVDNIFVTGSLECGVLVFMGSFADVRNSTIDGNGWGLCASVGSVVSGRNNTIRNSANEGVAIYQHGTYRARGDTVDNTGGGDVAISLDRNSFLDLRPGRVTGNIVAAHQSHLLVRRSSAIAGDVQVDILSELDLTGNSTVAGDVTATNLSIVRTTDGAAVDGKVKCMGTSICLPQPPE